MAGMNKRSTNPGHGQSKMSNIEARAAANRRTVSEALRREREKKRKDQEEREFRKHVRDIVEGRKKGHYEL